jgi:hypothetical protein
MKNKLVRFAQMMDAKKPSKWAVLGATIASIIFGIILPIQLLIEANQFITWPRVEGVVTSEWRSGYHGRTHYYDVVLEIDGKKIRLDSMTSYTKQSLNGNRVPILWDGRNLNTFSLIFPDYMGWWQVPLTIISLWVLPFITYYTGVLFLPKKQE